MSGIRTVVSVLLVMAAVVLVGWTSEVEANNNFDEIEEKWEEFKQKFHKKYANPAEEDYRRNLRKENLGKIAQHNLEASRGIHSYKLGENQFVDWTQAEYYKILGTSSRKQQQQSGSRRQRAVEIPSMPIYSNTVDVSTLSTTVNWTASSNWVGPVMNQGQCGGCWSYSAVGSIEAQYANVTGSFVQMSEQNLIDCSTPEGNEGCNGGYVDAAFWYVQEYGLETLAAYPDISNITSYSNYTCSYKSANSVTTLNSWRNIKQGSELALQQAVALVGPVSIGIDASLPTFQLYQSGVYSSSLCTPLKIDHAVLVTGYGVYNGTDYWLIQNSWGTSWGMNGYFMLARNAGNMCGVASDASFPVIEQADVVQWPSDTADGSSGDASGITDLLSRTILSFTIAASVLTSLALTN